MLWKRFKNGWAVVVSLYFFPQILSAVVFGFYIGTGHTLQLDVAFTVMTILTMIKDPLRSLPMFVGTAIEFMVSMRRIQAFMNIDEVNTTIIQHVEREEAQNSNSIEIMPGSFFHWGYAPADLKKENEKKGEKKKDKKKEVKTEPLLIPDQES